MAVASTEAPPGAARDARPAGLAAILGRSGRASTEPFDPATGEKRTYSWIRPRPQTGSLTARALAFAIDLLIVALLTALVWKIADALGVLPHGGFLEAYGFLVVAELPVGLAYFTFCEHFTGRTPGKTFLALQVARLDGARQPSFLNILVRNLLRFVWMTPVGPVFIALDLALLSLTEMEQRLGDLAAGTVVVLEHPSPRDDSVAVPP
jgi:uncharacterized RDD family membrane protein YckC